MRGGVMFADAFHLAALFFLHGRVVSDEIPCNNGCRGAPTTCGLLFQLVCSFGLHHWRHLPAKALLPPCQQRFAIPRGLCEETAEAAETAPWATLRCNPERVRAC